MGSIQWYPLLSEFFCRLSKNKKMTEKNIIFLTLLTLTIAEEIATENTIAEDVGDASASIPGQPDAMEAMMAKLSASTTSEKDQALLKDMLANMNAERAKLQEQQEALAKLTAEQESKLAGAEGGLAHRHDFQQPPLEKITKDALAKTKARWAEAAEAQRKAMEEGARLMKELREVSAAKVEELAVVQENLTKKEAEFDVLR